MSDSLTAASLHYEGGRYRLAADAFGQASKALPSSDVTQGILPVGKRKRKHHHGGDVRDNSDGSAPVSSGGRNNNQAEIFFGALPSIAASADAALCTARSALAKGTKSASVRSLLDEAVDANALYMRALVSASMRLRRSEAFDAAAGCPIEAGKRCSVVVNAHRSQLACAALVTGVSESWLHMALGDADGAEESLMDAVRIAVSCFWYDNSQRGTMDDAAPTILPPEFLKITSKEAIQIVEGCIDPGDERGRFALKTFSNATNAVRLVSVRVDSADGDSSRAESTDCLTVSNTAAAEEGKSCVVEDKKLQVQEFVTHALVQQNRLGDVHSDRKQHAAIRERRDVLLSKAVTARHHGPGGLAKRLQILLNGMELASHANSSNGGTTCGASIMKDLQSLVPVSGAACSLLGCILCSQGSVERALGLFQKKLDMDEKLGLVGTSEYKETVSNMAHCFSILRDAKPAQELLLHALAPAPTVPVPQQNDGHDITPLHLMVNAGSREESQQRLREISVTKLLWRLYHTSSLARDWTTCLASAEELCGLDNGEGISTADRTAANCAQAFALLQSHRPSVAMNLCTAARLDPLAQGSAPLLLLLDLYQADASISAESGFVADSSGTEQCAGILKACELTNHAELELDSFHPASTKAATPVGVDRLQLETIVKNNRGVALIVAGKTSNSMSYFKDAALAAASQRSTAEVGTPEIQYLQPHFNLALLLWREGHRQDAANVWMAARGLGNKGRKQGSSRTNRLRSALEESINHHGLFCAKRASHGHGANGEHIPAWGAETRGSGISKDQLYALDILVLQYAIAESAKNDSKFSRKREGSFLR